MQERKKKATGKIYHETGDLLVLLTKTINKWLYIRTLVNQYNYKELDQISEQIETLDTLFQAEKQIRRMRNRYWEEEI